MNYLKRSLIAIAGACIMASSAGANTLNMTVQMAGVPEYKITFYQNVTTKFFPINPGPEGTCQFCWLDYCYNYIYNWDGDKLIYIYNAGLYVLMDDTLFEIPFTKSFDKIK